MKNLKQFRLKALLLTIVASLTIGFTGCSDELSGDQTQGKPGYLTVNVKTLKPIQTKLGGAAATDYQTIKDLNIFVINQAGNVLIHKYYNTAFTATQTFSIPVNELATTDYVVAVANYGNSITETTIDDIEALDITTVRDVSAHGLHMTGKAGIVTNASSSYESQVKIAPVESKITVKWNFGTELTGSYTVTGVYVVNAISHTKLPIIRDNVATVTPTPFSVSWAASNIDPNGYINYTTNIAAPTRTAATGYTGTTVPTNYDFNRYATMSTTEASLLSDEDATILAAGQTDGLHYYVGENYSSAETALGAGEEIANANAAAAHANTIVIIKVTPTGAGEILYGTGDRFYTYEFDNESTGTNASAIISPNYATYTGITEGFSVRRKTNYNLTFNLSSIGATRPFVRTRTLSVEVIANPWDDATTNPTF